MKLDGFMLQLMERSSWDLCGSICIYQVIPIKKNLSLRHIAHEFMSYLQHNTSDKLRIIPHEAWQFITQWADVWKYCQEIMDDNWTQDYSGFLKRGILYKHGEPHTLGYCKNINAKSHDILAIVETYNHHLYIISGGWVI